MWGGSWLWLWQASPVICPHFKPLRDDTEQTVQLTHPAFAAAGLIFPHTHSLINGHICLFLLVSHIHPHSLMRDNKVKQCSALLLHPSFHPDNFVFKFLWTVAYIFFFCLWLLIICQSSPQLASPHYFFQQLSPSVSSIPAPPLSQCMSALLGHSPTVWLP